MPTDSGPPSHSALSVKFDIRLPGRGMTREEDLPAVPAGELSLMDLSGRLRFALEGREAVLEDDLASLSTRVMLGAVHALRAGERCDVMLYTSPGSVTFEPRADGTTTVTADGKELGTYPARDLADAFLNCAERIARAMMALAPGDAVVHEVAQNLLDETIAQRIG